MMAHGLAPWRLSGLTPAPAALSQPR